MNDKTYLLELVEPDAFQFNHLRQTAIEHYERCLSEQTLRPLETFIEKQMVTNPLHLELFYDINNDLQQRLSALREYHFDARKKVIQALMNIYQVDISRLAPPDQLENYHLLTPRSVIDFVRQHTTDLSKEEEAILKEMIESSTSICAQLSHDIDLTEHLITLLMDWSVAASITTLHQNQIPFWVGHVEGTTKLQ